MYHLSLAVFTFSNQSKDFPCSMFTYNWGLHLIRKVLNCQNNIDNTDQPTSQFMVSAQVTFPRKSSWLIAYRSYRKTSISSPIFRYFSFFFSEIKDYSSISVILCLWTDNKKPSKSKKKNVIKTFSRSFFEPQYLKQHQFLRNVNPSTFFPNSLVYIVFYRGQPKAGTGLKVAPYSFNSIYTWKRMTKLKMKYLFQLWV